MICGGLGASIQHIFMFFWLMLTLPVPIESVLLLIWIVPVLMLSVVLPVGVGCVCAYNLLGFQGRMIRRVGLGGRMGLGATESSGWQWWWHSLEGSLSPVNWLLGTISEQWSSTRVGGRAQMLYCWWNGRGRAQDMPWGLESGRWSSPAGRPVTNLFF